LVQKSDFLTTVDIAVNEVLFVHGSQTGGHLRRNFQRQLHLNPTRTSDEMLKGLSLDELHCIKVTAPGSTQVEDRGNIRVPHAGRRTRLAQETKPSRFVTEISLADDFQCHGAVQIDVERLVSDPIAPRPNSTGLPSSPVTNS
jgi:hypothetical protein